MQPFGLPVLPEVNSSAHSPFNSASCATTPVWHGGMRLSVSIRRARPSAAPFATCMRSGVATSRSAATVQLKGQFVGPEVRVDRDDRDPERVECEPMEEEDRTIFEQQGDARAAPVAGGGIFGAQAVDLRLECPVGDLILPAHRGVPRLQARAGMAHPAALRPKPRRHRMATDRACRAHRGRRSCSWAAATARGMTAGTRAQPLAAAAAFVNTLSLNYLAGQVDLSQTSPAKPGGACAGR